MPVVTAFRILLVLAASGVLGDGARAAEIKGIPEVVDANTLRIGRVDIKLWGISAPYPGQVCTPFSGGRPIACGDQAKAALQGIVPNKIVSCTPRGRDSRGRVRAECRFNGPTFNIDMVRGGWARAATEGGLTYSRAEKAAVAARTGLWRTLLAPRDR